MDRSDPNKRKQPLLRHSTHSIHRRCLSVCVYRTKRVVQRIIYTYAEHLQFTIGSVARVRPNTHTQTHPISVYVHQLGYHRFHYCAIQAVTITSESSGGNKNMRYTGGGLDCERTCQDRLGALDRVRTRVPGSPPSTRRVRVERSVLRVLLIRLCL